MDLSQFTAMLAAYWSTHEVASNAIVFLHLLGALALGSLVGYERAYHGRAAGMRTYGLVCMASAGLTVIAGFPSLWFGGGHAAAVPADPTRVMQGIVTGVGFLGAGVIVKEGLNISGLTTAASIWAASCIGVLVGVGFYAAAILLALLSALTMMWGLRLEAWLPSHPALGLTLRFAGGAQPELDRFDEAMRRLGYGVARGSLSMSSDAARTEWRLVLTAIDRRQAVPMETLASVLRQHEGLESFSLSHARN